MLVLRLGIGISLGLSNLPERGQAILWYLYWDEGIVIVVVKARLFLSHQIFYCQVDHR